MLHGYGGDGNDIVPVTINWKRFLPNTIFICPDGYQKCSINPSGFQWFDLTKDDPDYILGETIKAEKKLNEFIKEYDDFKTIKKLSKTKAEFTFKDGSVKSLEF